MTIVKFGYFMMSSLVGYGQEKRMLHAAFPAWADEGSAGL